MDRDIYVEKIDDIAEISPGCCRPHCIVFVRTEAANEIRDELQGSGKMRQD
jgi:hypothetical protein